MFSGSIDIGSLIKQRTFYRLIIGLALLFMWACQPHPVLSFEASSVKTKEDLIDDILTDLGRVYFVDLDKRGRTYDVLIKDFSSDDDETYAIVEELDRFWIIILPKQLKKNIGVEEVCACRDFDLSKVRKDLVDITRTHGLRMRFTVPKVWPKGERR